MDTMLAIFACDSLFYNGICNNIQRHKEDENSIYKDFDIVFRNLKFNFAGSGHKILFDIIYTGNDRMYEGLCNSNYRTRLIQFKQNVLSTNGGDPNVKCLTIQL